MKSYAIYYRDDGEYEYFMRNANALDCGVEYIRPVCTAAKWDPQETESPVDDFLRDGRVADICAIEEIEVKE